MYPVGWECRLGRGKYSTLPRREERSVLGLPRRQDHVSHLLVQWTVSGVAMVHGVPVQQLVEEAHRSGGGISEETLNQEDNLANKDKGKRFNCVRHKNAQQVSSNKNCYIYVEYCIDKCIILIF